MYVKYPRTFHFPWSRGMTSDDKVIKSLTFMEGKRVVATAKMDGENTSLYRDHYHARSLDSQHHPSRDWVKAFWSTFRHEIPEGFRICGENLYAQHSLRYDDLKSYFYMFSMWEGKRCLSWDETVMWADLLGIEMVPVLYDGIFDEVKIREIAEGLDPEKVEGLVVRVADEFNYDDFSKAVAKYVRANHVTTDTHWMHSEIKANGLA